MKLPCQSAAVPLLVAALALVGARERAMAQISVRTTGSVVESFDSLPPVTSWSTLSIPGGATVVGSGDVAGLDAAVQPNSADTINSSVGSTTANPPATAAIAQWSSTGRYLQTRAVGNVATLLMATLRNDSGRSLPSVGFTYNLATGVMPTAEDIPGHRVYYNLSGAAGAWVPLGIFSVAGVQNLAVDFTPAFWTNNTVLYLLFADDNAVTNSDGAYQIDNFAVTVPYPGIITQPQDVSVSPGQSVTLTVTATGTPPLFYQWRKNGTDLSGATNQNYTINNAQAGDTGLYSVLVSNAFGVITSSNALLTVSCATPVGFTAPPQGQTLQSGGAINLGVSVSGTQPFNYQWQRGGVAIPGATNQTYSKTNVLSADSGLYRVTVMNCFGAQTSSNAVVSIADAPYTLIGLTNYFWKYEQSGTDLGTAWRTANYNDGPWPSGRGIFAQETDAPGILALTNTVLTLTYPGGGDIPTYYFRTHFTLTNDPALVTLVTSNYVDDGAVVYLNGVEAYRLNMPAGFVIFNTLAPGVLTEGVFILSSLPSNLLVPGDNVLAVELHQVNLTSSDIDFGMEVRVNFIPPTVLQITNQPADLFVEETKSATLSSGVSGLGAHYQWFKDGVAVPGATATTLTFGSALISDQGLYTLVASNVINVVTSRVAALVVLVDQTAPVLLAAEMIDSTHVLASFSELLLAGSATNPALYSVTNTFGGVATVSQAVLTNGTNALLATTSLAANANYILSATGITDASSQHHALPLSAVPVARTVPLVSFGSFWEYFDPYPPFTDPDPGAGWKDFNYDTSSWGYDAGAFAYSQNGAFVPPVPVGTGLGITPVYATYFRAGFASSVSPGGLSLKLRHAVDDAAVFYLNGAEIHRFNMPVGGVMPTSPAAVALAIPTVLGPVDVSGEFVRAGQNLLTAELHQFTTNATQKFFAAELTARAESLLVGPLLVLGGPADVLVTENRPATFRVSSVAASSFQWQMNGASLAGATNATLVLVPPLSLNGAQFRCVCGGAGGPVATAGTTLHVLPDLTRPVLLSAALNSNGAVVLSFSKPLALGTAMNLANYLITNSAGVVVPLTGATLTNGTNVLLTLGALLSGNYTVAVRNLTDTAAQPNSVMPGSVARVSVDYFIPFDAPWKYLLVNTNDTVQAAFMRVNHNDSGWLGPSNGLLYVESAALSGPKNTLLDLFDFTGVNRINTYYFRKNFFAPIVTSNLAMQLRHIIDDGMVLHLNGQEIYRYNMPAGVPTAATQASANIGDATLLGPFTVTVTNLVAGTNVFAVEVHQNGATGSDVVMGVEISFQIFGGGLPLPNADPQARLAVQRVGSQFALVWGEPGFTLERAASVNGPWLPVALASPVLVSATNAAAFFRLRR